MSITPYNNFTVLDLSAQQQPYVNSSTEFGKFNNSSSPNFNASTANSLYTYLLTNNGIAIVDDVNGGLQILAPGVYKLKLSIDLFTVGTAAQSNLPVYYFFSTTKFSGNPFTDITNTFGSTHASGMFSFGVNAPTYPGIISWITNPFNNGTTSTSNLLYDTTDSKNILVYRYYCNTGINGTVNQGICTTEITFVIDQPTTIYFNTFCASTLSVKSSYFTLKLIYKFSYPIYNFIQTAVSIGTKAWTGISTSSTGQYVCACVNFSAIYRSSDYGVTWSLYINITDDWRCISISSDGNKVSAGTLSSGFSSDLYYFTNASTTRTTSHSLNNDPFVSTIMSSDGTKTWSVTRGGTFYYSTNFLVPNTVALTYLVSFMANASDASLLFYSSPSSKIFKSSYTGTSVTQLNSQVLNWQGIATDKTGTYLAAVAYGGVGGGIYTSLDGGNSWIPRIVDGGDWTSIASSDDGSVLAATNPTSDIVKVSTNYGGSWSNRSIINALSVTMTPDGLRICVAANTGYIYYAVASFNFP